MPEHEEFASGHRLWREKGAGARERRGVGGGKGEREMCGKGGERERERCGIVKDIGHDVKINLNQSAAMCLANKRSPKFDKYESNVIFKF